MELKALFISLSQWALALVGIALLATFQLSRMEDEANVDMRECIYDIMKRFNDAPAIDQAGSTYETRYDDAMRHAEKRTPEIVCKLKERRARVAVLNSWKRTARAAAISMAALYAVAAAFFGIAFLSRRTRARG